MVRQVLACLESNLKPRSGWRQPELTQGLEVGGWTVGALTDAGTHAHFHDKDDSHRESMGLGNRCHLQNVEGRFGLTRSGNSQVKVLLDSVLVSTFEDMYISTNIETPSCPGSGPVFFIVWWHLFQLGNSKQ